MEKIRELKGKPNRVEDYLENMESKIETKVGMEKKFVSWKGG